MNYYSIKKRTFKIKCYRCRGTGRIIEDNDYLKSSYKRLICPRCGGTGKTPKIK